MRIVWLKDIRKNDIPMVGGKAANLGEIMSIGMPVPDAFVITTEAFKEFIRANRLSGHIRKELSGLDVEDVKELEKRSKSIQRSIVDKNMPEALSKEIMDAYRKMKDPVAVRSSATAEDLPDASFAGQQASFLNVKKDLINTVKRCFASLYTARAISYRAQKRIKRTEMAVIVQEMVDAKRAGVLFTRNPVNGKDEIIIETVTGLGEALVSGQATPYSYTVSSTGKTIDRPKKKLLSDGEIRTLTRLAKRIEAHYGHPQDIEWAMDNQMHIVQARPITSSAQEWTKIMTREYGVQYAEISLRSLSPEVSDLVPHTFHDQIYIPEDNNETCYIGKESWDRLLDSLKKRWNVNNIRSYEDSFLRTGKRYVNLGKKLRTENLSRKSDKELKRIYTAYVKLCVRYTSFIWTSYIINNIFSDIAKQMIDKKVKDPHKYYEAVFTPDKKAAALELTARAGKLRDKRALLKLYPDYRWISCLDIHNEPWTKAEFLEHIRHAKEVPTNGSLLKRLKLSPAERKIADVAKRFAYIKDLRDDFRREGVYHIRSTLYKELARRMRMKLSDLSYLQEKEIVDFLDKGIRPGKNKRKKGFVMHYENRILRCASGRDIRPALSIFGILSSEKGTGEIKGVTASQGAARGRAVIIKGVKDLPKVKKGDIIIAVTTHPDYVSAMQKAAAIVTDEGGITCHAAIVARELKIPCIVGSGSATKQLKDGDMVYVDATNGIVYRTT